MTTSDSAGPVLRRDHRSEHEGCKAMWPWLKWCSRYRYASQLVGYALIDVEGMSMRDFKWAYGWCHDYNDTTRHRSSARSAYIAHRERWHAGDVEEALWSIQYVEETLGLGNIYFSGRSVEEQLAYEWQKRQEKKAYHVLWAYGMINKRNGQIELDRLKKLP